MEKTQLPVDTMAGAEWNVLNAGGMRVAICGTDNNHTVEALNKPSLRYAK